MEGPKNGGERVTFTKASAQRIADAVRGFEQGSRDIPAHITAPRMAGGGGGAGIKICKFTGSWQINSLKSVRLMFPKSTTENAVFEAKNLFGDITGCGERACAIAKSGTAWYLIAAQCQ